MAANYTEEQEDFMIKQYNETTTRETVERLATIGLNMSAAALTAIFQIQPSVFTISLMRELREYLQPIVLY